MLPMSWQCLKWSTRDGVAQQVMGDRATGGHKRDGLWMEVFFKFPHKNGAFWCNCDAILHSQPALDVYGLNIEVGR